jgi:hypothetical protein
MYRKSYCQQKAIQLYSIGKNKAEVVQMLLEEGADINQLEIMADTYYEDYVLLFKQSTAAALKKADDSIFIGWGTMAVGFCLSIISYLFIFVGKQFTLLYVLQFFGFIKLIKGLSEKRKLKKVQPYDLV